MVRWGEGATWYRSGCLGNVMFRFNGGVAPGVVHPAAGRQVSCYSSARRPAAPPPCGVEEGREGKKAHTWQGIGIPLIPCPAPPCVLSPRREGTKSTPSASKVKPTAWSHKGQSPHPTVRPFSRALQVQPQCATPFIFPWANVSVASGPNHALHFT